MNCPMTLTHHLRTHRVSLPRAINVVPEVSLPKILSKLKYGKGILPADNWNNFQDGAMDQINIYATIGEKHIKISKTFLNSDIHFTTPLALKK